KTSVKPCSAQSRLAIARVNRAYFRGRRIIWHERRAKALHAATFLIDENRGLVPPRQVTHMRREIRNLFKAFNIAREKNKAPGPFVAEKRDFVFRQFRSRHTGNPCLAV